MTDKRPRKVMINCDFYGCTLSTMIAHPAEGWWIEETHKRAYCPEHDYFMTHRMSMDDAGNLIVHYTEEKFWPEEVIKRPR